MGIYAAGEKAHRKQGRYPREWCLPLAILIQSTCRHAAEPWMLIRANVVHLTVTITALRRNAGAVCQHAASQGEMNRSRMLGSSSSVGRSYRASRADSLHPGRDPDCGVPFASQTPKAGRRQSSREDDPRVIVHPLAPSVGELPPQVGRMIRPGVSDHLFEPVNEVVRLARAHRIGIKATQGFFHGRGHRWGEQAHLGRCGCGCGVGGGRRCV